MCASQAYVQTLLLWLNVVVSVYVMCMFSKPYDVMNPEDRNYSHRLRHLRLRLLCFEHLTLEHVEVAFKC